MKRRGDTLGLGKRLLLSLTLLLAGWGGVLRAQEDAHGEDAVSSATPASVVTIDTLDFSDTHADTLDLSINTDSLVKAALQRPVKKRAAQKPDPIRAMWLGLVLPGAGQIYNRKYWKLPVFYGGFLGCTYALMWNNQMLHDYSQAYLDIMDSDPNTKSYEKMLPMGYDITGKEARFKETFKNKKNYFRKYRDMSIFAFGAVYLLSVIDAYIDAELSTFDITTDLSLRVEPTYIHMTPTRDMRRERVPGMSLVLEF